MELFNNIAKQQNTQTHTEQRTADVKTAPKQEVKAQVETRNDLQKVQGTQDVQKPAKSEVELRDLIDTLNRALDPFNTSIRFGFDNSNDVFFVSVIDTHTNDTIRRFPVEQAESLVTKMNEIVGIIFDEKG